MIPNATIWELFSWLWPGAFFWLLKAWFVGDLVLIYWMTRLRRTSLMIDYKLMMYLWLLVDMLTVVAHFFIWKDFGKWTGDSVGPLIVGLIYILLPVIWYYVFNVWYKIQISFYISIIAFALSIATTIWFIILATIPGILMIFVVVWNLYFFYWNFELRRQNTLSGNVDIVGAGQILVDPNPNAIPCDEAFMRAGRSSFLKFKPTNKFGNTPLVLGRNTDAVRQQQVFVPQNQFQGQFNTGQQTQFQGQFVNSQYPDDDENNGNIVF